MPRWTFIDTIVFASVFCFFVTAGMFLMFVDWIKKICS